MKERNSQYKISVIVPIFNSSETIITCIESIINQTFGFDKIQLILIDDGSTDNIKDVLKPHIKKHNNIEYYYKKNGGAGSARNYGIKKALANVISFVDSDDWIDNNMYEILFVEMQSYNLDIVTCDIQIIKKNKCYQSHYRFVDNEVKNFIIMNMGSCNMLIRKKVLEDFSYPEGIIYEDLAVIPALALRTSNIKLIEKPLYFYNNINISVMKQPLYNENLKDIFQAFEILENQFSLQNVSQMYREEVEYVFIKQVLLSASLRFLKFNDPENQIVAIVQVIKEKYPNWKENKYYKLYDLKTKIIAHMIYHQHYKLLKVLYFINRKILKK